MHLVDVVYDFKVNHQVAQLCINSKTFYICSVSDEDTVSDEHIFRYAYLCTIRL